MTLVSAIKTKGPSDKCVLHLVGVEIEVSLLPLFAEVGALFPDIGDIEIDMVGLLSWTGRRNGEEIRVAKNVLARLHHGDYTNVSKRLSSPDLIVGLNAGLEGCDGYSWPDAIKAMASKNVPAFFTDYARAPSMTAIQELMMCGANITLYPAPNPFRSPLQRLCKQMDCPWYANGFIFGICGVGVTFSHPFR